MTEVDVCDREVIVCVDQARGVPARGAEDIDVPCVCHQTKQRAPMKEVPARVVTAGQSYCACELPNEVALKLVLLEVDTVTVRESLRETP